MGVPGADDVMLNYQSTSFHDALYLRQTLDLAPAPEFSQWLQQNHIFDENNNLIKHNKLPALFSSALGSLE